LIVARDQRLSSVGNVARRLEGRARREPNAKKQPRQKMYPSHVLLLFSVPADSLSPDERSTLFINVLSSPKALDWRRHI
jgi:hypothetical protein